jgi:hypothetical protein
MRENGHGAVMPIIALGRCLNDPNLFGRHFRGASWRSWRVFLAALFAEAVGPDDLDIYRAHTGRTAWPTAPFREAAVIVGRRGGKSRTLALIAVYLACFRDYGPHLAAGEVATIGVLAVDKGQARAIFRFVLGLLKAVPMLEPLIVRRDSETIELSNRVHIEIATASFRSTRGYSYAAVLADEVAFWRSDETSLNPDIEILRALRPGLASIPGAMLLMASSPYAKRGELYNAYRRHFGKDDGRVLVWKASTQEMNPSIDKAVIEEAYESDPESARAEYGGEFRDDLADFVSRETVDAMTMQDRHELPPEPGVTYAAFCDPSGGVSDSLSLAIAHLDRNAVCILDALLECRPPFDPEAAVMQCAALCRRYGVAKIVGDRYAGEWPRARFAEHGIEFEQSARPKSDLYHDLLPLLNARRIELLDLPRLSAQLCGLERRTARSGRDSIDHAPGGHDDLANAVAGALVMLDLDRRPALVRIEDVTGGGGVGPRWLQYVYAMIIDAGADIAIVYCGSIRNDPERGVRQTLWVLDLEVVYFKPGLWAELVGRLKEMAPSRAVGVFAPEHLAVQFSDPSVRVEALPPEFDPELMLTFAAECIGAGLVKFCPAVTAKMKTQTIAAALALRAGDPVETALRAALIGAIFVKHGREAPARRRKLA